MTKKAVLFDLDGTLFDTAPDIMAACNHALVSCGYAPLDEKLMRTKVTSGMRAMLRLRIPKDEWAVTEPDAKAYQEFSSCYTAHASNLTKPFPGIPELIGQLQSEGFSLAVISNKYVRMIKALFAAFPFTKAFSCVLGGDSTQRSKPDPQPLLTALEALGVRPENALYAGDFIDDVTAARGAGCLSCAVQWGYGQNECGDISLWGADLIAKAPGDILSAARERLGSPQ